MSRYSVIRTYNCELLILNNQRCEPCAKHRKVLLKLSDRKSNLDESFVPFSHKQALVKLHAIQKDWKSVIRSRENQLRKIQNVIEKVGVKVDTGCQELFMKITNEKKCSIFDENPPQYLLWEEQKKQASYKNSKSMRWHPVFIRWCLAIYLKSPSKQ